MEDLDFMTVALELAKEAAAAGDGPLHRAHGKGHSPVLTFGVDWLPDIMLLILVRILGPDIVLINQLIQAPSPPFPKPDPSGSGAGPRE